jgi:hypothetical protein
MPTAFQQGVWILHDWSVERLMRKAVVFSIPLSTSDSFAWRWRSEDHARESDAAFRYYLDCVEDAKRYGYTVEVGRVERESV